MAFTNTYDTTFPVDTQLANLLGADLRNFRVDTQQRMAAISGLDAAKPTFNLDAQPANWNGILFFATDTGKIYKFTNPTWTDITSNFYTGTPTKLSQVNTSTAANGQNLFTITIAAGVLKAGSQIMIDAAFTVSPAGTNVIRSYGGTIYNNSGYGANASANDHTNIVVVTNTTFNHMGFFATEPNSSGPQSFAAMNQTGVACLNVTTNPFVINFQQSAAGAITGNGILVIVNP